MSNPNFAPEMSTNAIYVDQNDTLCLTDLLDDMQTDIEDKADSNHTHSEYSPTAHEHSEYSETNHTHTEYASNSHEHSGYAPTSHNHSYNDLSDKPTIPVVPFIEDTTYPGCFYRTVNGVTEWINPPLIAGVEYRITERYKGDVVYVKHIAYNCAAITALETYQDVAIPHGISNYACTVRATGVYKDNSNILPYFGTDKFTAITNVGSNSIVLRSINKNWDAGVWNFVVYYTKSE